jgi:hypothetical protein
VVILPGFDGAGDDASGFIRFNLERMPKIPKPNNGWTV